MFPARPNVAVTAWLLANVKATPLTVVPKDQVDGSAAGTGTAGYGTRLVASAASYSTVAISRSLTSGATLAATYSTADDSLTLKASVAF